MSRTRYCRRDHCGGSTDPPEPRVGPRRQTSKCPHCAARTLFSISKGIARRPIKADGPLTRLSSKAAVAAQAFLLHTNRAWKVHLAKQARISPALTHRVLARLEAERIAATEGSAPNRVRRVKNPAALLELYAEENAAAPIRTLAYSLAETPQELMAAANLVAPFITVIPITEEWVTTKKASEELSGGAQAKAVTGGAFLRRREIPRSFSGRGRKSFGL